MYGPNPAPTPDDDTPSPTQRAASQVERARDGDTVKLDLPATGRLPGEKEVVQLELSHDGPFGFHLTLRLDVGAESAGLFANLYYYDAADRAMVFQAAAEIGAGGSADLPFAHASSWRSTRPDRAKSARGAEV